jgi:hypothetical protein
MNAIKTLDGKPVDPSRVKQIDADTVEVDGKRHRLSGMNAPETAKLQGGLFVPAQVSQDDTERLVNELAVQGGFTDLRPTGKTDPYDRSVSDQVNKRGVNLGDQATVLGLTRLNRYTKDEVVRDQIAQKAAAALFPSLRGHDPVVKAALDRQEEQAHGEKQVYFPKAIVADEKTYAGIKNSLGTAAVQRNIEEIERLSKIIEAPDTPEHIRTKANGELDTARENLLIAATTEDPVGGVAVRRPDRNIMNQARNQLSTSWNLGLSTVNKSFGGILQLAGDEAKWDWLSEQGASIVTREKIRQGDMPTTLSMYKDIDTKDPWSAVADSALWVGNNLTSSLPMMAALIGGGIAAGAAGATGVGGAALASLPASLLYSGQYYAEQEEGKKNSVKAIGYGIPSAVLDRIGLTNMMGTNILTKAGRQEATQRMLEAGLAKSAAEADKILLNATKREILEVVEHSAQFAKRELSSVDRLARGSLTLASKAGVEGGTEAAQTLMEMLASTDSTLSDLTYERDFAEQLINAAAAGTAIGGSFSLGSGLYDTAEWHSAMDAVQTNKRQQEENHRFNTKMQTEGIKNEGVFKTPAGAAAHFRLNADKKLSDLEGDEGTWKGLRAVISDPVRLVRGLSRTITPNVAREDGSFREYRGILKAIISGSGLLPGENYSGFKQRLMGAWQGDSLDKLARKVGTDTRATAHMLRDAAQDYWMKGQRIPEDQPYAAVLQEWKDKVDTNRANMMQIAERFGVEMPELAEQDFLLQSALVTPSKIHKNRERLISHLKSKGLNDRQAGDTLDGLLSGNPEKAAPAAEMLRKAGVYENKDLNDLFEPNIFASMESAKQAIASRIANRVFLGDDGSVLANLLEKAKANGEFDTEAEYRDAVTNVKAWYAIEKGDYNPMKDYPVLEKIAAWGTTLTMLAGLGKATISSIPEMAIAMLGTKGNLMSQQVHLSVKEWMREWRSDFNKTASAAASSVGLHYARNVYKTEEQYNKIEALQARYDALASNPKTKPEKMRKLADEIHELWRRDFGRNLFERLGYNETSYNTQAKYELPYSNMKKTMNLFAELIGLRALTDGNRMAVLGMASDAVISKLAILGALPAKTRTQQILYYQGLTNEQAQAVKELTQFGMNVPMVLDYLDVRNAAPSDVFATDWLTETGLSEKDPEQMEQLEVQENILATLSNLVDSKITNPQPHNLPKYYYDPRFRLITAMTRFIAAQTTTVLPNLYKNYIKEGSAAMRYQAFATIFAALMFAAFADALKDELAYDEGVNPFIQGELKRAQRTVYSSSLLGKGEAAVSMFAPLYPERKDPTVWDRAKDVSPVLSWADRAVRGVYNATSPEGKEKTGVQQIVRSLPVVGSYPRVGGIAADALTEE